MAQSVCNIMISQGTIMGMYFSGQKRGLWKNGCRLALSGGGGCTHRKNRPPLQLIVSVDRWKMIYIFFDMIFNSGTFLSPLQTNQQPPTKPNSAVKPTKYHYYPHNQHIYLLPECATQQVSECMKWLPSNTSSCLNMELCVFIPNELSPQTRTER